MNKVQHPIDRLIFELVVTGRKASHSEIKQIIAHIAQASFSRHAIKIDRRLIGRVYLGQVLEPTTKLPSIETHLLKRIYVEQQWNEGTSLEKYISDLRHAVKHPASHIWTYEHRGAPCVGILAPSHVQGAPNPEEFIFVVYNARFGVIATGFQASTCGRKSLTRRTCSLTRSTNSNRQGCLFDRWAKNFYPRVLVELKQFPA